MNRIAAAALAGLLIAGSQTAAMAQPAGDAPPGSRPYCNAQWRDMVAANTTNGQTRGDFMNRCLTEPREGGGIFGDTPVWIPLAAAAGVIAVVALVASSGSSDHPQSP